MCKHLKIGNVGVYLYKYIYIIMFILLSGLRNVGRAILGRAIHVDLSGNQFFSRCFDSGSDDTSQNLGNLESRDSWQQMVSMTWKILKNLTATCPCSSDPRWSFEFLCSPGVPRQSGRWPQGYRSTEGPSWVRHLVVTLRRCETRAELEILEVSVFNICSKTWKRSIETWWKHVETGLFPANIKSIIIQLFYMISYILQKLVSSCQHPTNPNPDTSRRINAPTSTIALRALTSLLRTPSLQ